MRPNKLFLERCDQMALLLESRKEVELLDLGGLLRQLLFDKKSLVDTVNTKPISLEFHVSAWPHIGTGGPPTLFSLEDGLDPETAPPGMQTITLSRDQFGNYPVTYFQGQPVTVKDVIRYASNVAGGVHYDPQPRAEFDLMGVLSQRFGIAGLPLGIRQLKASARVTMRALYPLIEDVKKRS